MSVDNKISTNKLMDAVSFSTSGTLDSIVIDLGLEAISGSISAQYVTTGSGSFTIVAKQTSDIGTDGLPANWVTTDTVVSAGVAASGITTLSLPVSKYLKFTVTEGGTDSGTVTLIYSGQ